MLSQPSGPSSRISAGGVVLEGTQNEHSLNPMEQSSDIYPPKAFPAYNPNLKATPQEERRIDARQQEIAKQRARDPILDSTPDIAP